MTDAVKTRLATLTDEYNQLAKKLVLGGGPEKIEKIHKQGKLTARERIGLLLGKVPTPIGEAMYSMPVARSLQVAQRTGILGALAEGPRDPTELAEHLGLQPKGTIRVLDVIATLGHVKQNPDGRYEMTKSGRT